MAKKKKGQREDGRIQINRSRGLARPTRFYGKTKAEAERKYQQAVIAYAQELASPKDNRYTFCEIASAYEDYITSSASPVRRGTISAYRKHIKPAKDFFGDTPMDEIDPQAVRGYLEHLKAKGRSRHTISNARSVVSCIFSYWCAEYHGTANPVLLAKLPAGLREGSREEPTEEQCNIIHAHPEGCGFWAQLFEYTGLRMGEANGLQWKDVDLEAGIISPVRAMPWDRNQPYEEKLKTENAYRRIPILSPLRPVLEAGKASHRPEDFVLSGTSKPLTQSQYSRRWTMYCRPLGLCTSHTHKIRVPATATRPARETERTEWTAQVTAHQFRHLYATNLFYAGVPDKVAQQLLGHADIMTTRRVYQHLREKEDAKYTALLEAYVCKGSR